MPALSVRYMAVLMPAPDRERASRTIWGSLYATDPASTAQPVTRDSSSTTPDAGGRAAAAAAAPAPAEAAEAALGRRRDIIH